MVHAYDILVHWYTGPIVHVHRYKWYCYYILVHWYTGPMVQVHRYKWYCYYIYCMIGITEAISFNVSSTIPPSPIPANTMLRSYIATTRDNDIVMRLPEDGSVVYSIYCS